MRLNRSDEMPTPESLTEKETEWRPLVRTFATDTTIAPTLAQASTALMITLDSARARAS